MTRPKTVFVLAGGGSLDVVEVGLLTRHVRSREMNEPSEKAAIGRPTTSSRDT